MHQTVLVVLHDPRIQYHANTTLVHLRAAQSIVRDKTLQCLFNTLSMIQNRQLFTCGGNRSYCQHVRGPHSMKCRDDGRQQSQSRNTCWQNQHILSHAVHIAYNSPAVLPFHRLCHFIPVRIKAGDDLIQVTGSPTACTLYHSVLDNSMGLKTPEILLCLDFPDYSLA